MCLALVAALLAVHPQAAAPTLRFVDAGPEVGLANYAQAIGMGGGVAAADWQDDGDVDLFVPTRAGGADQLYRNDGVGALTDVAASAGVDSLGNSRVALWLDADGDRDLDLLVGRDGFAGGADLPRDTLLFWRQGDDDTFEDATLAVGLAGNRLAGKATHLGGMCAGDLDRDGYVDLCVSMWEGKLWLFANQDGAGFVDVSLQSGVGGFHSTYWQPLMHDFDEDGWQDLFLARDFVPNQLWINQRDGTFVDVAPAAGLDYAWNEMGATLGDFDNDLDLDLYITNVYDEESGEQRHNALFLNLTAGGVPAFAEVSERLGVDQGYWGWGTTFLDADRDGLLDLAATNGADGAPWKFDPSRFFKNHGAGFDDVSGAVGFNDRFIGGSLVAADLDRDGRLDLVQTCKDARFSVSIPMRVLMNRGDDAGHSLVVRPRTGGTNHFAIGAVVRARVGELWMTRLISAGTSFLGQEPAEATFGWTGAPAVDELVVAWPDGTTSTWLDVAADQVLTVTP